MGSKQLPKRSGVSFFGVVMRRHETRSTMMTSNRPLEDWGKLIGDVPAATAILDSLPHHAEILTLKGQSYRLKDRAGRAEAATKGAATEEAVVQSEREGKTPCRRKPK